MTTTPKWIRPAALVGAIAGVTALGLAVASLIVSNDNAQTSAAIAEWVGGVGTILAVSVAAVQIRRSAAERHADIELEREAMGRRVWIDATRTQASRSVTDPMSVEVAIVNDSDEPITRVRLVVTTTEADSPLRLTETRRRPPARCDLDGDGNRVRLGWGLATIGPHERSEVTFTLSAVLDLVFEFEWEDVWGRYCYVKDGGRDARIFLRGPVEHLDPAALFPDTDATDAA